MSRSLDGGHRSHDRTRERCPPSALTALQIPPSCGRQVLTGVRALQLMVVYDRSLCRPFVTPSPRCSLVPSSFCILSLCFSFVQQRAVLHQAESPAPFHPLTGVCLQPALVRTRFRPSPPGAEIVPHCTRSLPATAAPTDSWRCPPPRITPPVRACQGPPPPQAR